MKMVYPILIGAQPFLTKGLDVGLGFDMCTAGWMIGTVQSVNADDGGGLARIHIAMYMFSRSQRVCIVYVYDFKLIVSFPAKLPKRKFLS